MYKTPFHKNDRLDNKAWGADKQNENPSRVPDDVRVVEIDWRDKNLENKIRQYHRNDKIVIVYMSVGTVEPGCDTDYNDMPTRVYSEQELEGWDGEKLFIPSRWRMLRTVLRTRLKKIRDAGADAFEVDNLDFGGTKRINGELVDWWDVKAYGKWLAETGHELGMAAVMKNGSDHGIAESLQPYYDALIVEESIRYDEVESYTCYKGKPVWAFEYGNGISLSKLRKMEPHITKMFNTIAWADSYSDEDQWITVR